MRLSAREMGLAYSGAELDAIASLVLDAAASALVAATVTAAITVVVAGVGDSMATVDRAAVG